MVLLEGTLKTYDWGSKSAIAKLRGVAPSGKPEAELWFEVEGSSPWLVKILAIQKPLSIQLHPNAKQAIRGFENEETKGIKLDDPKRSYRDKNSKSELVCALTSFKAFCGLRETNEAIETAKVFDLPEELYAPLLSNGPQRMRALPTAGVPTDQGETLLRVQPVREEVRSSLPLDQ